MKSPPTLTRTHTTCIGVLARAMDALRSGQQTPPYKSNLFSITGSKKILSGSKDVTPNIVDPVRGITRFSTKEYPDLKVSMDRLAL